MSACNIVQQADAIHLITDGAHYDYDGRVIALVHKAYTIGDCIFATRGVGGHWPLPLRDELRAIDGGLDRLLLALPPLMRIYHALVIRTLSPPPPPEFGIDLELTVAGWSDARQALECWMICTGDATPDNRDLAPFCFPGYAPYAAQHVVETIVAQPGIDGISETIGQPLRNLDDLAALDVPSAGIAIIEMQRETPFDAHGLKQAHLVGGFAELSTVRRSGIEQRILKHWGDRVGEFINPDGA